MICFRVRANCAIPIGSESIPNVNSASTSMFFSKKLRLRVGPVSRCLLIYILSFWGHPLSLQTVFKLVIRLNLTEQSRSHRGVRYAGVEQCVSMYQLLRSSRSAFAHSMSLRKKITAQLCHHVWGVFFFRSSQLIRLRNRRNLPITVTSYNT